jgi:DNA-binding YbaB/EbfC family protein
MKQAQILQQKMKHMQDESASKEYIGASGGGLVKISMSGSGEMIKVSLDPSLLKIEEQEMLEDLIVAAHNDAKSKANADSQNNISNALGDLSKLPEGFGF